MNGLGLRPLTCPGCGAPGLVREGTRITDCDRCGARLCLTETASPRYEVEGRLSSAEVAEAVRAWLDSRDLPGTVGRPELILVPYHEMSGRRVGVFDRTVPERIRRERIVHGPGGQPQIDVHHTYEEKPDTKVMLSDIEHLAPAARTPWDLGQFQAREARRTARLRTFDLADAQRRAVVYAEEESASAFAARRFTDSDAAELVAVSLRTLFFPFWATPVRSEGGDFEVVLEGLSGKPVAWRMPQRFPGAAAPWLVLAVPGALAAGQALRALIMGTGQFELGIVFALGFLALAVAVWRTARPDWRLETWPDPGMPPR